MVSIVIPTWNEQEALPQTLSAILRQTGAYEVIVADGGSTDQTQTIVSHSPGVQAVPCPRGRAKQMNEGARYAQGTFLLFLHADTQLPPNAIKTLNRLEENPRCLAGGFHQRFDSSHPVLFLTSWLHNFRTSLSLLFYGDQAVFVRSSLFWELGGYSEEALLEDVDLGVKLRKKTRPFFLSERVLVSSRKFKSMGVWRAFAHVWGIFLAYNWFPGLLKKEAPFFKPYR